MAKRKTKDPIDAMIEKAYYANCCGIEIDIFDISKVFAVGRVAHLNGLDVSAAIVAYVQTIRKN